MSAQIRVEARYPDARVFRQRLAETYRQYAIEASKEVKGPISHPGSWEILGYGATPDEAWEKAAESFAR